MQTLPLEIVNHILTYDKRFVLQNGQIQLIKQFSHNDGRYSLLSTIPFKKYDIVDNYILTYVYLSINHSKDFYIQYNQFQIQIQTLIYHNLQVYNIQTHTTLII